MIARLLNQTVTIGVYYQYGLTIVENWLLLCKLVELSFLRVYNKTVSGTKNKIHGQRMSHKKEVILMRCPDCGKDVRYNREYCPNCSAELCGRKDAPTHLTRHASLLWGMVR